MQLGDRVREIVEVAGEAWVLKKRAEDLVWLQVFEGISDDDLPTKWLRAHVRYGDRLRQAIFIDKDGDRLRFMQLGDRVREIVEVAGEAWVLKKRAEDLVWLQVFEGISDDDPPTKWLRARGRYGDRLRQAIFIDKVSCRPRLRDAMGERHRLCRRRRLVEQRSVGDIEP